MRTPAVVLALAAVVAVAVSAGLATASSARSQPVLRVLRVDPFVVRGVHFRPRERVLVRVIADGGRHFRRVRADRRGVFVVTLRGVRIERCEGYYVIAIGAKGSRAVTKPIFPLCPIPLGSPRL